MPSHRFLTFAFWLLLQYLSVQAQSPALDPLTNRVHALERLVKQLQAERARATWDDYGCVPDKPAVDNGPMLSRILAEQGRAIPVAPVGKARDYYVSSTIVWPKRHGGALVGAGGHTALLRSRNPGVTRLIWNGPAGKPILEYSGAGGRIEQIVMQGRLSATGQRAWAGIVVLNDSGPPTGFLTTDQLSLCDLEHGIIIANYPGVLFGNQLTHRELFTHGVDVPYWVMPGCGQSTRHVFYTPSFKSGFKTIFRMDSGGPLVVHAPYIGQCDEATLLYLGEPGADGVQSGNGLYAIRDIQVDGNAKNLRMVDHGRYAGRVRIDGSYSVAAIRKGMAEPIVLERDGASRENDVRIDCTNGVVWPKGVE